MSALHSHQEYLPVLDDFNRRAKSVGIWKIFKDVHMLVSKHKCPICECALNGSVQRPSNNGITVLQPTIDHFRPKDASMYPHLQYDHENYILMCSDCNNAYKGNLFPLHSTTPNRNLIALKSSDIHDENPLIINPIFENPFDLFKIVLRLSTTGKKVLELIPKHSSGYLKEKAEETIRVFSLGKCDEPDHCHSSINVQTCRIDLLHHHFTKFNQITSILNGRNYSDLTLIEKKLVFKLSQRLGLDEYGFFEFVMKANYVNLIP
jgi:hypothetical protein